ncbi:MAG: peptidoglycan-binding domain-containing protein [Pseudomonadota bacterium]
MPLFMSIGILGSVGARGKNDAADVRAVQNQLNALMNPPRRHLTVDGKSGKKTIGTIRDFQRSVCRFRKTDGRVDPDGKTLRALNNATSEGAWAGCSMVPDDYIPQAAKAIEPNDGPPSLKLNGRAPAQTQHTFDRVWAAVNVRKALAARKELEKFTNSWLDEMATKEVQDWKPYIAMLDLMVNAIEHGKLLELVKAFKIMNDFNFGNLETSARALSKMVSDNGVGKTVRALAEVGKNPKLANFVKGLGKIAFFLAFIICAIEAKNHFNKGLYGAAFKEIYKCAMALGCLPLALLDAVETVWKGMDPGVEKRRDSVFFEIVRGGNLLDHGGNAIDAAITIVQVTVESFQKGKIDMNGLDALVDRMRNSSGKSFVELGEFLGDWYYDRLVDANKTGEELGDYIGEKYGKELLPLIDFLGL